MEGKGEHMRVDGDIGVFREYCAANHKTLGCHGGGG